MSQSEGIREEPNFALPFEGFLNSFLNPRTVATMTSHADCRMYESKYPDVDDVVMVQVKSIAEMGAYVSLLEYNGIEGMILLSELSRRRIRSITKLIKVTTHSNIPKTEILSKMDMVKISLGCNVHASVYINLLHKIASIEQSRSRKSVDQ